MQIANGLLRAHSYSVLEVRTLQNGERLIKLRNPWRSSVTWQGEFGAESPNWTQDLLDELQVDFDPEPAKNDFIWMSESEFAESFASLTICRVRPDDETLRLKGEFMTGF